jgi:site-specific DNA-methyltransferase (adenine-specific)
MLKINEIYMMDCIEGMKLIDDAIIDLILCDLPYGTTASSWDSIINFKELWKQYERIIKPEGAIVLTASGTFTNKVINSNEKLYKYKWIWEKSKPTNFVNAKNRPLSSFEEVLVFSKGNTANGSKIKMNYNPQGLVPLNKTIKLGESKFGTIAGKRPSHKEEIVREFTNYPRDILKFASEGKPIHPSQKPLELFEYLIKTYTKESDLVLDNCLGSGTTCIAALNTNRNYLGFETEEKYFKVIEERIKKWHEENDKSF